MSKGGRKPKNAVKVAIVFLVENEGSNLDNVSVSESDIPSRDGEEG